jgi:hypothetical protein
MKPVPTNMKLEVGNTEMFEFQTWRIEEAARVCRSRSEQITRWLSIGSKARRLEPILLSGQDEAVYH